MSRRRLQPWLWLGQAVLAVAVLGLMARTLRGHWDEFRALDVALRFRPAPVVGAAAVVLATYAILIEAWRRVLAGWDASLPFPVAGRIWVIANLGRYLPGKVWTIAGLAALAERAGVRPWAAAASAGVMQLLALGTGLAIVAATVPLDVPGLPSGVAMLTAAFLAAGTVGLLSAPRPVEWLSRRVPSWSIRPLAPGNVLLAAVITAVAWMAYGISFWLLARGLLPDAPLSLRRAAGVFAAGYITGLLALFAPGGAGVREVVFLSLLTPTLGAGGALALSVASRLLLTVTEGLAAVVGLLLSPARWRTRRDAS
jgi:hypothetical protein